MKKILLILIALVSILLLSGCSEEDKSSSTYDGNSSSAKYEMSVSNADKNELKYISFGIADNLYSTDIQDRLSLNVNFNKYNIEAIEIYYTNKSTLISRCGYGKLENVKIYYSEGSGKGQYLRVKFVDDNDFYVKNKFPEINSKQYGNIIDYLTVPNQWGKKVYVFYFEE